MSPRSRTMSKPARSATQPRRRRLDDLPRLGDRLLHHLLRDARRLRGSPMQRAFFPGFSPQHSTTVACLRIALPALRVLSMSAAARTSVVDGDGLLDVLRQGVEVARRARRRRSVALRPRRLCPRRFGFSSRSARSTTTTRRSPIIGSCRAASTMAAAVAPFSPAYIRSTLNARSSSSTTPVMSAASRAISASSSPSSR